MRELAGLEKPGALRPEAIRLCDRGHAAQVKSVSFLGAATRVGIGVHGVAMTMLLPKGAAIPRAGDTVQVCWDKADLHVMDGA
jgi:putative spermidine/putrescine transport system ATP-binding protein